MDNYLTAEEEMQELDRMVGDLMTGTEEFRIRLSQLVYERSEELQQLMAEVAEKNEAMERLTAGEVQNYIIALAGAVFETNLRAEELGLIMDEAKRKADRIYNQAFKNATGGREMKAAVAELAANPFRKVEYLTKRAYWSLVKSIAAADGMINALKKSLGYQEEELNVYRSEYRINGRKE